MPSYGGAKANKHGVHPEHPWQFDLNIAIGRPCCGGAAAKPGSTFLTDDLSEENEDRVAKAAAESVRLAFEFARKSVGIDNILRGCGKSCRGPGGG